MIELFRPFVSVATEDEFILVISWLVAAIWGKPPFPILILSGEQGSGKSLLCRLLRLLVDPHLVALDNLPRDEQSLAVVAANKYLLVFDNVSSIEQWLSDALCKIATGAVAMYRSLYTDRDVVMFNFARPIILNGITYFTPSPDLAERAIFVRLAPIPEERRVTEAERLAAFKEVRGRILGGLLDSISAALRNKDGPRLKELPRMADFAQLMADAEPGLGWQPGTFTRAYAANRREAGEVAFEVDAVAGAIAALVKEGGRWHGSATELLADLSGLVSDGTKHSRAWPATASALSNRLSRLAPVLRVKEITITKRHSGDRAIIIAREATGAP